MILFKGLFKGLNRLLGFAAGITLYPAKSIIVNALTLVAAAILVTLLALPVLIALPIYLGIQVGKATKNRGLGFLASLLAFIAIPIVAVVGVPVAALAHIVVSVFYDLPRSFINGIIDGVRVGLFNQVLSHFLFNVREFSTTLTKIFGPAKENNASRPSPYSSSLAREDSAYDYRTTKSANQPTYSSSYSHATSHSTTTSHSTIRVERQTSSYGQMSSFMQTETEDQNSALLDKAELSKAAKLDDKDARDYLSLHQRLTNLDNAIKGRADAHETLKNSNREVFTCEVTGRPITNPGLLVQSYDDVNANPVIVPSFTKIVEAVAITSSVKSKFPTSEVINGEKRILSYDVKDYQGLDKTEELQEMAATVRKKLPYDDVMAELQGVFDSGVGQFTKIFQNMAQVEETSDQTKTYTVH